MYHCKEKNNNKINNIKSVHVLHVHASQLQVFLIYFGGKFITKRLVAFNKVRAGITYRTHKEGEGERGVSMDSSCWNGHTAKWLPNANMTAHLPSGSTLTTGRQSLCRTPPYNRQKFSRAHMYMCIYIHVSKNTSCV